MVIKQKVKLNILELIVLNVW